MSKVTALAVQVGMNGTKEENLQRALHLIDEGMREYPRTDIICLPEVYCAMPTAKNKDEVGEALKGRFLLRLSSTPRSIM